MTDLPPSGKPRKHTETDKNLIRKMAYGRLYANKGAMTPGPDGETVDGMSMGKIERIIDALRHERFRFKPVRRVYIVRREALCCIPNTVGRNLEDRFWA
jgi:retron-type reverse transcriptase